MSNMGYRWTLLPEKHWAMKHSSLSSTVFLSVTLFLRTRIPLHTISLHAAFYWVSIDVGASVQFQTQIIKSILFSNYTLWYINCIYSKNTRNKTTVPVTHNTAPRGGRQKLEVRAALVPWLLLVEDEKNDLGNRSPIGPMSTGAAEVVTGR